jgi:hypothetical protein
MIQSFWDAFRLDRMAVWYLSDSQALLLLIMSGAAILAVRFHMRQKTTRAATPAPETKQQGKSAQRTIMRALWTVEAIAIAWIYWINSEIALDGGQRVGLYGVSFLLMYTLVLSLHRNYPSPDAS